MKQAKIAAAAVLALTIGGGMYLATRGKDGGQAVLLGGKRKLTPTEVKGREQFLFMREHTRHMMKQQASMHLAHKAKAKAAPKLALSATCDGVIHWVDVPGAICSDGSQSGFQYLCTGAPTDPLEVFHDGGGACWDGDLCDCQPDVNGVCTNPNSTIAFRFFGSAQSCDGEVPGDCAYGLATSPNQLLAFNTGWNWAWMPYCTGDVGTGRNTLTYSPSVGPPYSFAHQGFDANAARLAAIKALFPAPTKVATWGDCAGGPAMDCALPQMRDLWPNTSLYEFAANVPSFLGVYDPLIPVITLNPWKTYHVNNSGIPIGDTCKIQAKPNDHPNNYSLAWVARYNRDNIYSARKSFSDDYHDAFMNFFANLLGATGAAAVEEPNFSIRDDYAAVYSQPFNFKRSTPFKVNQTHDDTVNYLSEKVYLSQDQVLTVGTCGLYGTNHQGNTFIRVFDPNGVQVAFNDNGPPFVPSCGNVKDCSCKGGGAYIQYTVPSIGVRGNYEIRFGCKANAKCSSTNSSWTVAGPNQYHVFLHDGFCHDRAVNDLDDPTCDYSNMNQDGVYLADWMNAWLEQPVTLPDGGGPISLPWNDIL